MRTLKRLLGREKARVQETAAGVEYWKEKDGDALVTRQANIRWLIEKFDERGLTVTQRLAGQFSENYRLFSTPAWKKLIHGLNSFWFQRIGWAAPAFGNILVFRKPV